MNYQRKWADSWNAAGFAGACARLALRFYDGDHRSGLVAAIEVAEHYAVGKNISRSDATNIADAADPGSSTDRGAAAYAAAYAADTVAYATDDDTTASVAYAADDAAANAAHAGVDDSEIQIAYARWVTRDLACGRELPEELRQAAGAAIVAGDEELARELLG